MSRIRAVIFYFVSVIIESVNSKTDAFAELYAELYKEEYERKIQKNTNMSKQFLKNINTKIMKSSSSAMRFPMEILLIQNNIHFIARITDDNDLLYEEKHKIKNLQNVYNIIQHLN